MSLSVALSAKSVSSRLIEPHIVADEYTHDGVRLYRAETPRTIVVLTATSADQELQALVTIEYDLMMREDDDDFQYTAVSLHIQVVPAAGPIVSHYRTVGHRFRLPPRQARGTSGQADVAFSSDRKFLLCLVPYPDSPESAIVVFQLRKPRAAPPMPQPPLPSYIVTKDDTDVSIPIATNPRFIFESTGSAHITAICDTNTDDTDYGPSLLLAGCHDGSLLAISYRPVSVAGSFFQPTAPVTDDVAIAALRHVSFARDTDSAVVGRLVALRQGSADIYGTRMAMAAEYEDSAEPGGLLLRIDPQQSLSGSFHVAEWISSDYLAVLDATSCSTMVYGVTDKDAAPLASWDMTRGRLMENAHTTFIIDDEPTVVRQTARQASLQYDVLSDCLAISATLKERSSSMPFVAIWNWRSNVEGLVVRSLQPVSKPGCSSLLFAKDSSGERRLVHTVTGLSPIGLRIRKDSYPVGVLSPLSSKWGPRGRIRSVQSLLLSADSISYPFVRESSLNSEFEVEWRDSLIPMDYRHARGAAHLAAIGPRLARSLAVASSRGFCALDCGDSQAETNNGRLKKPVRWYRFGSEAEESLVEVRSMAWWEGSDFSVVTSGCVSDDVLVALIQIDQGPDKGLYLSCWSQGRLDFDHQLLRADRSLSSSWGIRLPRTFRPTTISILEQPCDEVLDLPRNDRKALVLLVDQSARSSFAVYQLQAIQDPGSKAESYKDLIPFHVFGQCASKSEIGSPAELFLAGASFHFNLKDETTPIQTSVDYVATLGVVRFAGGGVDALAVSGSGISGIGQIIDMADDRKASELSRFWQCDFVRGRPIKGVLGSVDCFVWCLEMACGDLVCWSVPYASTVEEAQALFHPSLSEEEPEALRPYPVHPKSMILGWTAPAGKTALWMQQTTMGSKRVLSLGSVPRSCFGCLLGSGQECRKKHQALGEEFEIHLFRPDLLAHETLSTTDFVLSLPGFLPFVYSLMLDAANNGPNDELVFKCIFRHLGRCLRLAPYRDSAAFAMQLLVLRVIEKVASAYTANAAKEMRVFSAFYATMTRLLKDHLTDLQFATLFLDVGRQIEPSCVRFLFPLPSNETARDLFHLALENGSISTAVAALPLLESSDTIRRDCAAIYHLCLNSLGHALDRGCCVGFETAVEERAMVRDVFRYALKLDAFDEESSESYTSDDSSVDGTTQNNRQGYSIMCGLGRFFAWSEKDDSAVDEAAHEFINHAFDSTSNGYGKMNGSHSVHSGLSEEWTLEAESVAGVTARFLLAATFATDDATCWSKAAATAAMLLGRGSLGMSLCSTERVGEILRATKSRALQQLLPSHTRQGGLTKFFVRSIQECQVQIGSNQVSQLLDLLLILLGRHGMAEDLRVETPGLISMAIVAGHVSERITEVIGDESSNSALVSAYFEAQFELMPSNDSN